MRRKRWTPNIHNLNQYDMLKSMLNSLKVEFDILSKKKTDDQLNTTKIRMVNKVLNPLKELLKHEDSYIFLETLDEDNIPSNSDVVLIISQYQSAIDLFWDKYHDEFGQWEISDLDD